jgi:nitroimidazol reductase NimA-like FMN-containing flavoprotein (pyridoxamine 5'-phosphate oxidase superfamily)
MYHMRRGDKEVTDPGELRRVLLEAKYVTLALCVENEPYIATLSHGYDIERNVIYFHCAGSGKKLDFLRRNPAVWGQALLDMGYQQDSCDHLFQTTQFRGAVEFVTDVSEKRHALEVMVRQIDEDPEPIINSQLNESSIERITIGKIKIDYMSGKRADRIIISM